MLDESGFASHSNLGPGSACPALAHAACWCMYALKHCSHQACAAVVSSMLQLACCQLACSHTACMLLDGTAAQAAQVLGAWQGAALQRAAPARCRRTRRGRAWRSRRLTAIRLPHAARAHACSRLCCMRLFPPKPGPPACERCGTPSATRMQMTSATALHMVHSCFCRLTSNKDREQQGGETLRRRQVHSCSVHGARRFSSRRAKIFYGRQQLASGR